MTRYIAEEMPADSDEEIELIIKRLRDDIEYCRKNFLGVKVDYDVVGDRRIHYTGD